MGYPRAANRSSCLHDHPWPENLARDYRGWAYCTACYRGWQAKKKPAPKPRKTPSKPPQQWYVPVQPDPIAIERAVAGDPPARLTPRERRAAVAQLTARGYNAADISERVRCTPRTVYRIRSRYTAAA